MKGEATLKIVNRLGLHARAATKLVQLASKFKSKLQLEKDGDTVNGKSITSVLMLAATRGSTVTVKAEGDDAYEALRAIAELVENKFGEDQ